MSPSFRLYPHLIAAQQWFQDRIRAFTAPRNENHEAGQGEDIVLFADSEGVYRHLSSDEVEAEQDQDDSVDTTASRRPGPGPRPPNPLFWLCVFIGLGWTIGLYATYPAPSTVPFFIGSAFILSAWVIITWISLLSALLRRRETARKIWSRYSTKLRVGLGVATILVLWWAIITLKPTDELWTPPTMIGTGEKYFIAVNLYNNEAIMSDFINELTALIFHRSSHLPSLPVLESVLNVQSAATTSSSRSTSQTPETGLKPS